MGRSVSTPTNCAAIAYRDVSGMEEGFEWDDFKEWIVDAAQEVWPSLETCDEWLDREDHAILENGHCYIGVSEYCGLAAIWLMSKRDKLENETACMYNEGYANLADHWCEQVADKFSARFGEYRKIGTGSNGVAFFERAGQ